MSIEAPARTTTTKPSQIVEMKIIVSGMAGLLEAIAEAGLECTRTKTFQTDEGKQLTKLSRCVEHLDLTPKSPGEERQPGQ